MKLAVVVGTRPEIIKMAPVIREARRRGVDCRVLHTGQHYSFAMDGVFFEELELPRPDVNLEVGSGSHVGQIAAILERIEPVLAREAPDWVLVEGDTNSVLAAATAAQKMGLRVGHVEAGLRSYDRRMPEELNRILTDHLSEILFAPTEIAHRTLISEGIPEERIRVTGNTVVDELLRQRARAEAVRAPERFGVVSGRYALATLHRGENVDDPVRLRGILTGLAETADQLDLPVLAALHPRTAARMEKTGIAAGNGVRALPPLPYLDFLGLHAAAALVLTDSGGLQEEACCLGVPCVVLRDNTERPEALKVGAGMLAGADPERILAAARVMATRPRHWPNPFGDGRAAGRILDALLAF